MLLFTDADTSEICALILKVPVNWWCEQMADVWQMQKMHYSIASVVDFSVRRHFFEHGDMGHVKSCKTKNDLHVNIIMLFLLASYTGSGGSIHLFYSLPCKNSLQVKILLFAKCTYSKVPKVINAETLSW